MDLLYHYTSASGLLGILDKYTEETPALSMWATNALYMNDPSEFRLGQYVFHTILPDIEAELNIPESEQLSLAAQTMIQEGVFDKLEVGGSARVETINQGIAYVLSLSQERDTLPMWRMYAQNGNGLAIVFDKKMLTELYGESLKECMYATQGNYGEFKEIVKNEYIQYKQDNSFLRLCNPYIQLMFITHLYHRFCAYLKDSAYAYEKEVRLKATSADKILYREKDGLIIPYVTIQLPISCVKEIIIGPTADPIRMKMSISMYLQSKGIDDSLINISHSTIPYRG